MRSPAISARRRLIATGGCLLSTYTTTDRARIEAAGLAKREAVDQKSFKELGRLQKERTLATAIGTACTSNTVVKYH